MRLKGNQRKFLLKPLRVEKSKRRKSKIGKLEKHLGKGEPIEIEGEEYILKPLTTEFIPDFFKAMKAFSGAKEGASNEEMLKNIDDAGLKAIQRIIEATVDKSFPDEPEKDRREFGLKYMATLMGKIFEMNSGEGKNIETIKKAETLKRLKNAQSARTD